MQLILTGSLAYDHIMVFPDQFKNHLLPEKIHILNVAFNVNHLQKEFGGTAGNIAYALKLLGEKPVIVATAGKDFASYRQHLRKQKISAKQIKILRQHFTAQAFITTDQDDNQITAFYGGAMFQAEKKQLETAFVLKNDLVIISPNGKNAMLEHSAFCQKNGIKFIFDPGQSLTSFTGLEIKKVLKKAYILVVNDYEWQLVQNKTGLNNKTVFYFVENLIVTLGPQGSLIQSKKQSWEIPAVKAKKMVDPTGCGDAYRAGLLFGLSKNYDLKTCGQIATTSASFAIEKYGTQNHCFSLKNFWARYKLNFGDL